MTITHKINITGRVKAYRKHTIQARSYWGAFLFQMIFSMEVATIDFLTGGNSEIQTKWARNETRTNQTIFVSYYVYEILIGCFIFALPLFPIVVNFIPYINKASVPQAELKKRKKEKIKPIHIKSLETNYKLSSFSCKRTMIISTIERALPHYI